MQRLTERISPVGTIIIKPPVRTPAAIGRQHKCKPGQVKPQDGLKIKTALKMGESCWGECVAAGNPWWVCDYMCL